MRFVFFILFFFTLSICQAQSVIDELDGGSLDGLDLPPLAAEKVTKISLSGRIVILTNSNNSFGKGDFITLIKDNKLAVRALVAKVTAEGIGGIKLLKIYDLNLWKKIRQGDEVQVLKGDDTAFLNASKANDNEDLSKIKEEEDLFNAETQLEDDQTFETKGKRHIKQDNVVSLGFGSISTIDIDGGATRTSFFNGSWAYQIQDNIWAEAQAGYKVLNDFPFSGLDTALTTIIIKGKYTFSMPFYSYILPYVGYQITSASSPGAGQPSEENADDPRTDAELQEELELVANAEKSGLVFGITVLKRLVPGWFGRLDLGTDLLSIGIALEF